MKERRKAKRGGGDSKRHHWHRVMYPCITSRRPPSLALPCFRPPFYNLILQPQDEHLHVRRGREAAGRVLPLGAGIPQAPELEPSGAEVRLFQGVLLRRQERPGVHGESSRGTFVCLCTGGPF